MIEIKSWVDGKVLYTAENAQDVRQAFEEAVKAKADLRFANLRFADLSYADLRSADLRFADLRSADLSFADLSFADLRSADLRSADLRFADLRSADLSFADLSFADLRSADLRSADLRSADLRSADLRSANLSFADLSFADLRSADLRSANLRSADDWRHPLWVIRQDFLSILDQAPAEVPVLRETMLAGKINGSVYRGECACLAGTIAKAHGCDVDRLGDELGITTDASRPAEQWFVPIDEGNTPLPTDTEEWPDEGTFRLSWALAWLDEWVESRTAIAKALAGGSKS